MFDFFALYCFAYSYALNSVNTKKISKYSPRVFTYLIKTVKSVNIHTVIRVYKCKFSSLTYN